MERQAGFGYGYTGTWDCVYIPSIDRFKYLKDIGDIEFLMGTERLYLLDMCRPGFDLQYLWASNIPFPAPLCPGLLCETWLDWLRITSGDPLSLPS